MKMKDFQIDKDKFVPPTHVTIASNFLVHELANVDPTVEARYDVYVRKMQNSDMYKKQFWAKHGITTEEEYDEYLKTAAKDIIGLRKKMEAEIIKDKDIQHVTLSRLEEILNNPNEIGRIITKYKTKESEWNNDIFLRSNYCVYRCKSD